MEHGWDWGREDCSPQKTLHLSSLLPRASPTVLNDLFESSFPGPTDNPRVLQLLLAREPLPSIFPVALAGALPSIPTVKGRLAPLGQLHSCLIHPEWQVYPPPAWPTAFLPAKRGNDGCFSMFLHHVMVQNTPATMNLRTLRLRPNGIASCMYCPR